MRRAVYVAAALASSVVGGGSASAKAPKAGEMPSVEEIAQQVKGALDKGAQADKPHDAVQDTIDLYKDRTKTPLSEFQPLVDVINNVKETQQHRMAAADALVLRFLGEDLGNAEVRGYRRAIGNGILELMKVDATKDPIGLDAVDYVIGKWWRSMLQVQVKFVKSSSQADRKKAYEKMKKLLKSES